ncbi:unnamed protein product [Rotaria sp. Silwood2]|nr:unnamed protein product [Rotaria sp. Silwood2]CAF4629355.1 unnamed protein product [Rotaria sp. Silwood2]
MIIAKYLYVYLGFFLAFVGSIGNLLTFSVFVRRKKYRSLSSSTFLAGSTFGEQLVLLSSAFPDSLTYALNYDFYGISIEMCKSTSFLYFAGGVVALTCMYLAAIERYLQTCRSSSQREWMTLNRARLIVFLATLVSSDISIPFALYRNVTSNNQSCEYVNANFKRMAPLMYAIVGVPMPITLLSVFGFLTWRNLKTPTQRQRTDLATHKLNNQVVRMILIQTSIVVLSILPASLLQAYFLITDKNSQGTTALDHFILCITQLLLYVHSCASLYVYVFVSRTFRHQVQVMLCLKRRRSTRVLPFTEKTRPTRNQTIVW